MAGRVAIFEGLLKEMDLVWGIPDLWHRVGVPIQGSLHYTSQRQERDASVEMTEFRVS